MIGRTPQQFIDDLSYGVEQTFSYHGQVFFVEGITQDDGTWVAHVDQWEPAEKDFVWQHSAPTMAECLSAFLDAPLFDGHTFWEAEGEMTSLYS
jgi:hypothetical protein